ncbi:MAG: metallophosphoesterase [Pseudomonadota bacterium]|nr:metallophosphoesterase [Pseudomonadota bacterium]
MATILHLSDLHFGAHLPKLVDAVVERAAIERPDLIVISGDFTQRAKTAEYEEAEEFLDRLREGGHEVLAVPGNHDIPLYDVLRRFLSPLTRYKKYINEELCPFTELDGVSILGINTARSATFKDGSISHEQIRFITETFADTDPGNVRILVTHHPLFALPVGDGELGAPVDHQQDALAAIAEAGVDLLLAGHNHRASNEASELVKGSGRALVIQAGTATSSRVRGENQSFNLLTVDARGVTVTVESWSEDHFERADSAHFKRSGDHWELGDTPVEAPADPADAPAPHVLRALEPQPKGAVATKG